MGLLSFFQRRILRLPPPTSFDMTMAPTPESGRERCSRCGDQGWYMGLNLAEARLFPKEQEVRCPVHAVPCDACDAPMPDVGTTGSPEGYGGRLVGL